MAISDQYRAVLRETRALHPEWGRARRHSATIVEELHGLGIFKGTVLDYGCGLGGTAESMHELWPQFHVSNYDPSIPEFDSLPYGLFDCVACTHVLEHIEPELLEKTLLEIRLRTESLVYIEVPHGPAVRVLSDGRNAHLIQQPRKWWEKVLTQSFAGWNVVHRPAVREWNTVFVLTWK